MLETYPYITENNLENRQHYMYSRYQGRDFLGAYRNVRHSGLSRLESTGADSTDVDRNELIRLLDQTESGEDGPVLLLANACRAGDTALTVLLDKLVHAFEIRKRIHSRYDENFKPVLPHEYGNLQHYSFTAAFLAQDAWERGSLRYLNALLKINDTLLSRIDSLTDIEARVTHYALRHEQLAVNRLMDAKGVSR